LWELIARNSRLSVLVLIDTANSSRISCAGSTSRQRRPLVHIEASATPGGFAVDQVIGSVAVEPQNPVAHRPQADATDPRRFAPAATVINHRQRQKPTDLPGVTPRLRQPPQLRRREAAPQPDRRRHRNLPRVDRRPKRDPAWSC